MLDAVLHLVNIFQNLFFNKFRQLHSSDGNGNQSVWTLNLIATTLHHVASFRLFFQSLAQSGKMTDAAHADGRRANISGRAHRREADTFDCRPHFGLNTRAKN